MPLIFRGISKTRWNQQKHTDEYDWLKAGDIPAETFVDVVRKDVQQNELSVYLIDESSTSLERMLAAFAVNRDRPDKLDYKLIDYELLLNAGFEFKETSGDTPDEIVNSWHRDLHYLTTQKLAEFVRLLYFEAESERKTKIQIEKLMIASIKAGNISESKIENQNMRLKIEALKTKY